MNNFQSIIIHWKFAVVLCLLVLGSEVVAKNADLTLAKKRKKDEFYTQLVDIENELRHYREHFKGKVVLCNCDDPRKSNFFKYFADNFEKLQLKRLIATCYKSQDVDLFSQGDCERAICQIYEGDKNGNMTVDDDEVCVKELKGDGDFRSAECIEILKQADIVVTNPPFSLFREYVAQLVKYDKKFVVIGNQNAITYKEIFPLIKENKLWLGFGFRGGAGHFYSNYVDTATAGDHREGMIRVSGVVWFTNLEIKKRHERLPLYKQYSPDDYPEYDNYDAINIDKTCDIPIEYDGVMGVPITFLDKFCPEQFEIVGITKTWFGGASKIYPMQTEVSKTGEKKKVGKLNDGAVLRLETKPDGKTYYLVDGVPYEQVYARILIRHRKPAK